LGNANRFAFRYYCSARPPKADRGIESIERVVAVERRLESGLVVDVHLRPVVTSSQRQVEPLRDR
jgi:hypothetical protein